MYACNNGRFDVVNYFSVRRINLNVLDLDGKSLLVKTLLAEQYELASKLIIRGADVDFRNSDGQTALTIAINLRRIPMAKYLLVNGANPHIEDRTSKDSCDYA